MYIRIEGYLSAEAVAVIASATASATIGPGTGIAPHVRHELIEFSNELRRKVTCKESDTASDTVSTR